MKISLNFQTAECIFKKINFLLHQLLKKRISFILFFKLSTPEKLALHSPVKIPFSHNLILMTNNFFYSRNAFLCFMLLFNKIPKIIWTNITLYFIFQGYFCFFFHTEKPYITIRNFMLTVQFVCLYDDTRKNW